MKLQNMQRVGMAELAVTTDPGVLVSIGLGSCIGLTLYDPVSKIAGMAHIMLPSSEIARDQEFNKGKFADTAVPELIQRMQKMGASVNRLVAKLAGGAQMFSFAGVDTMRIGQRNAEASKEMLRLYQIPVLAEDTGGNYGRSIEFYTGTGILVVRSIQYGVKEL